MALNAASLGFMHLIRRFLHSLNFRETRVAYRWLSNKVLETDADINILHDLRPYLFERMRIWRRIRLILIQTRSVGRAENQPFQTIVKYPGRTRWHNFLGLEALFCLFPRFPPCLFLGLEAKKTNKLLNQGNHAP